jgi:hypothetical protein
MAGLHWELPNGGLPNARRAGRFLSFASAVACAAVSSGAPSADLSRATRRLGSSEFTERHEAGDLLLKAGPTAIPYLREAAESDSPEIRFRALGILERIELQLLDVQKAEILSGSIPAGQFVAFDRFLEIVDDSPPARRLFVAMLERSPQLMVSFGTPELQEAFDRKLSEWAMSSSTWPRRSTPDGGEELAALMLAAFQPETSPTPFQVQLLSRSAEYTWFQTQLKSTERRVALRSLLSAWIVQPRRQPAESRLHLAAHYQFPEGVIPAREIVDGEANGVELQNAILFLSLFGDQDQDLPRLEKLLNNQTELQSFQSPRPNQSMRTQIRDVALVALWKLKKQDPAAHGMKDYREQNGVPRAGLIGFRDGDDQEREAAIAHWRIWRKQEVKADLPSDGWAIEGRRG